MRQKSGSMPETLKHWKYAPLFFHTPGTATELQVLWISFSVFSNPQASSLLSPFCALSWTRLWMEQGGGEMARECHACSQYLLRWGSRFRQDRNQYLKESLKKSDCSVFVLVFSFPPQGESGSWEIPSDGTSLSLAEGLWKVSATNFPTSFHVTGFMFT